MGQKQAKNHKKIAWCRKNRLHFGTDSGVLCRRTNACIGCNGPTHSRFPSRAEGPVAKNGAIAIRTAVQAADRPHAGNAFSI